MLSSRTVRLLLVALCVALAGGAVAAEKGVQLAVGEQTILSVKAPKYVAVGDETVAVVTQTSTNELLIVAKKAGQTNLIIEESDGTRRTVPIFITKEVAPLQMVQELLADIDGIEVKMVAGRVAVTGTVISKADKDLIERVVKEFTGVLDLTRFAPPTTLISQELARLIREADIYGVDVSVSGERIVLKGVVYNASDKERALAVAGRFGLEVVDLLTVQDQMIEVDVMTAVVDVGKALDIGQDYLNALGIEGQATAAGQTGGPWGETAYDVTATLPALSILRLLQDNDASTILSRAHASTVSGQEATFLSGATEYFVVQGTLEGSLSSVDYGVELGVTPTFRAPDLVATDVQISVSSPAAQAAGSSSVLALVRYKSENVLLCKMGESVVVSGLGETISSKTRSRLPVLGDIPILNVFFGNSRKADSRLDLIFIVTPMLPTVMAAQGPSQSSNAGDVVTSAEGGPVLK